MYKRYKNMRSKIPKLPNDLVLQFMAELASRVVAKSGNPSDRFHLGKLILQSLKDAPDFVCQMDGGTGQFETNASVLERSVRCASCLRNLGLVKGDVIVLMAPNHLDLAIPYYAAMYTGVIIAAIDRTLGVVKRSGPSGSQKRKIKKAKAKEAELLSGSLLKYVNKKRRSNQNEESNIEASSLELRGSLEVIQPKLVFCQSEKAPDVQVALNDLDLNSQIVTFDKGDYLNSFEDIMENHGDHVDVEEFQPTELDPDDTMILIATSGTTGLPKSAAATYKNFATTLPYFLAKETNFPTPVKMSLVASPLQWLTAIYNFTASPLLRFTRLQTSRAPTPEHMSHIINTYKPTFGIMSPTFLNSLLKLDSSVRGDLSCLETLLLGGSAVPNELIKDLKVLAPDTEVFNAYGMSELTSLAFHPESTPGSCGKPMGCWQYRLINAETQEDITEPNTPGELWIKGPGLFKEYYQNPEATEETFAAGGWFKTGDMFYRNEHWSFFYVERIKLLLKYMNNQISPVEIESVIRQIPGVLDVAVSGIPDEQGELPVACVVRKSGSDITAEKIKDYVKNNLADYKQLRGGVIFLNEIPMTASTKVHRRKLKEMVIAMDRE